MLSIRKMADEVARSPTLVARYAKAGMPMDAPDSAMDWMRKNVRQDPRSRDPVSAQPQVMREAPADSINYQEERARRERAEANLSELKLLELRGELLRRADMERIVGALASQLKESVLQVKARLAPLLAAETDAAKVSAMLDLELRAALDKAAG